MRSSLILTSLGIGKHQHTDPDLSAPKLLLQRLTVRNGRTFNNFEFAPKIYPDLCLRLGCTRYRMRLYANSKGGGAVRFLNRRDKGV